MFTKSPEEFNDPKFDFEGYFERSRARSLTESESEEFHARIIGMFCRDIFKERKPPDWVLEYIANEFSNVLHGKEWVDAFPLPWTQRTSILSRSEELAAQISCDVANILKDEPSAKVTEIIREVASKHNVSYETARAAWYARRQAFKGFLNLDSKK
jgi:hypothetical protein